MRNDLFSTRKLVFMALFIALNVVLTRYGSIRINFGGAEAVRIGVGALPVIFTGVFFGPIAGAIVGGIGDVVGFAMFPMGAYMPHFTVSAALTGLIPGLLLNNVYKDNLTFGKLLLAIGVGQIVTSVLMTPYFQNMLFGIPFVVTIPPSLISQAVNIPLYAMILKVMSAKWYTIFVHHHG